MTTAQWWEKVKNIQYHPPDELLFLIACNRDSKFLIHLEGKNEISRNGYRRYNHQANFKRTEMQETIQNHLQSQHEPSISKYG